jgi:SAM-dependent methyltransferase
VTPSCVFLSLNESTDLLRIIGLARCDGQIYANQKDKFEEVLAMAQQLTLLSNRITKKKTVTLLDCGCGKGYVSFILNHILTKRIGRLAFFIGVDRNGRLIEKCVEIQRRLRFSNMEFHATDIIEFAFDKTPDLVYCLHACDVATDETIAKGILCGSRFIVAVPCCQREIRYKMRMHPLTPMTQFPNIKEQLSCLVTDAMRALVLAAAGYKVEIFEFVPLKTTPKNLMLRAEKIWPQNIRALRQYWQIRQLFNVEPKIEEYLPGLKPE